MSVIEVLLQALVTLNECKRSHTYCEDGWYSCPLAPDGCLNDSIPKGICTCGADKTNAEIRKTSQMISDAIEKLREERNG